MNGEELYKKITENIDEVGSMKKEMRTLIDQLQIIRRKIDKYQKRKEIAEARLAALRGMSLEDYAKEKEPQKPKGD